MTKKQKNNNIGWHMSWQSVFVVRWNVLLLEMLRDKGAKVIDVKELWFWKCVIKYTI